MKNRFKVLGIITLAAIIGFSMTGCNNGSTDNTPVLFELTVTGDLPSLETGYTVWGGSLMQGGTARTNVVATGMINVNSGRCVFYTAEGEQKMPNFSKPFNTDGEYVVGIAQAKTDGTQNPNHTYISDTVSFSKNDPSETLDFGNGSDADFELVP